MAVSFSYGTALALCVIAVVSCTASPPADSTAPKPTTKPVVQTPIPATVAPPALQTDFAIASAAVQGGILIAQAPSNTVKVTLNGAPLPLNDDGFFLIGFDRDNENSASLVATLRNGKSVERYLPVRPGNWKIENVNANPTGGAGTTAEFQARRGSELARINAARRLNAQSGGWRQQFIWPTKGRISGFFGSQRIYRGTPGSYHSGMDIAAVTGTPFVAPADGVVILAARDEFTLEGHLLMIDHGMGLNSAFLHGSELFVREGDSVRQGQVIGKTGATGRVSGPHLHWGMKWNNARIDPMLLLPRQAT